MISLTVASPLATTPHGVLVSSTSSPSPLLSSKVSFSSASSNFHGIRLAAAARGGGMVVRMAKREEELKEIREKTTDELNEDVVDLKGELFLLRLQKSARNEFKSSEFRRMRKRIARMLTVKREREIEQGIGKRLSRKLDKKWKRSIVVRPPPSLRQKQGEEKAAEADRSS